VISNATMTNFLEKRKVLSPKTKSIELIIYGKFVYMFHFLASHKAIYMVKLKDSLEKSFYGAEIEIERA
jgi:hypothetical protein